MTLEEIKKHPAAYRLFASRLPEMSKTSDGWVGLCPFHSDSRQSFSVYNRDGIWLWRCHGPCDESGNVVQFLSKLDKLTIPQAIKKATEELAGNWDDAKAEVERVFKPFERKDYVTVPAEGFDRAIAALAQSKEAVEYLAKRGLTVETAQRLRVGFAQDMGKAVPVNLSHLRDKGWVIFPTFDGDKITSIKYRSIAEKAFFRKKGMQTLMWNADRIDLFEPVFVVEGEFDAMTIEQAGYRAVSIPSGTARLTSEDLDKIASASQVYLAGDVDTDEKAKQTGQKAMERIAQAIPSAKRIIWEGAKDANDVLMTQCGGDINLFRQTLERLRVKTIVSPMEGVYDVALALENVDVSKPADNPNRLRFPWKGTVDEMVTILPGDVLLVSSTVTGTGKTQWVNQLVLNSAREAGDVVLSYQCEITPEVMYTIIASHLLQKDRNTLTPEDYRAAAKKMGGVRYYIGRDDNLATVGPVLDLIEKAIVFLGATVVVLDPIHFVCRNEKDEVKAQADASQRIKRMAHKYGVKFVVVGHPRKQEQKNRGKVMGISDWKGSGSGGDDADAMVVIHRDQVPIDPENPPKDQLSPIVEIHLLKGRTRGVGGSFAKLLFMGDKCTFGEMTEAAEPAQYSFN